METPRSPRHNSRGSPRRCNPYPSLEVGKEQEEEAHVFDTQELFIGSSKNPRGVRSNKTPTPPKAQASPEYKVGKRVYPSKKGGKFQRNAVPEDVGDGGGGYRGCGNGSKNGGYSSKGGGRSQRDPNWRDTQSKRGSSAPGQGGPSGQGGAGGAGGDDGDDDDDSGVPFTLVTRKGGKEAEEGSGFWYKASNRSKNNFARGEIWNVPYHMPNLDKEVNSAETATKFHKMTFANAVCSKFRYVIILWKFGDKMIVVPLYTFDGEGITKKSSEAQKEMLEIMDASSDGVAKGKTGYEVLKAKMNNRRPKLRDSCVRLTAAFSVDYKVDMQKVGELVGGSKGVLLQAMDDLIARSKGEAY